MLPRVLFVLLAKVLLIGVGEIAAAILLVLPWTAPLGTLVTSGFWGGVICIHMSKDESILVGSVFLVVTWVGSFLRGSVPLLAVERDPSRRLGNS